MEVSYIRNKECDRDLEKRFGKPLWSSSYLRNGIIYTPLATPGIWRIDIVEGEIKWKGMNSIDAI